MMKTIRAVSPDPIDTDAMIGEVMDGYVIKRRIASGGMGVVYEGVHAHLGRKYAIKMLQAQFLSNPQIVSRFIAEGQRTNQIAIDGVVAVHHVGRSASGVPFLVMDYIDGETLASYRRRLFGKRDRGVLRLVTGRRATPSTGVVLNVLRLARQLAQTLCLIHEQGVVHRDLKPDNIFVVRDSCVSGGNRVKVLDFGIAKNTGASQVQSGQSFPWAPTFEPTVKGTTMGTPPYMPPEQWEASGTVHPKSDVYACGVIFYELMCGSAPFASEYIGQLMEQHKTQKPTPLIAIEPWVPLRFSELVDDMLRKNPADRPDMPAVLATLDEILREQLAVLQAVPNAQGNGVQTLFDGLFLASRRQARARAGGAGGRSPAAANRDGAGGATGVWGSDLLPWRRQRTRLWALLFSASCLLVLLVVAKLTTPRPGGEAGSGGQPSNLSSSDGSLPREFVVHTEPSGASVYLIPEAGDSLDGVLVPRCQATPCTVSVDELKAASPVLLIVKEKYRGLRLTAAALRRDNYQIFLRLLPLSPERPSPLRRASRPKPPRPAAGLRRPAR